MSTRRTVLLAGLAIVPATGALATGARASGWVTPADRPATEASRAQEAGADGGLTLSIAPYEDESGLGYFALTMEPGEEATHRVQVANLGGSEATARTYAADAYTLPNGGLNALTDAEDPTGPTTWLDYPARDITLEPESAEIVDLGVAIPEDTAPGQYVACLVVQNADPYAGSGGIAIDQVIRQVIAVAIDVPGDLRPGIRFDGATYQDAEGLPRLSVALTNTGNVHVRPAGRMALTGADGEELGAWDLTIGTLLAGLPASLEVLPDEALAPGEYAVTVRLEDEELEFDAASGDLPLTVAAPATPDVATPVPPAATISELTVDEIRTDGTLQLVNVAVTVDNPGAPLAGARLTLRVERDGALVEDLVLGDDVSFPGGASSFAQRYLPLSGWEPGTYTFTAILELVDPATGEASEVATRVADTTVVAP